MGGQKSSGRVDFDAYVEALIGVIGHADRAEPLRDYCLGLMMPVARKSVKPLAAVTAPPAAIARSLQLFSDVPVAPEQRLIRQIYDAVRLGEQLRPAQTMPASHRADGPVPA